MSCPPETVQNPIWVQTNPSVIGEDDNDETYVLGYAREGWDLNKDLFVEDLGNLEMNPWDEEQYQGPTPATEIPNLDFEMGGKKKRHFPKLVTPTNVKLLFLFIWVGIHAMFIVVRVLKFTRIPELMAITDAISPAKAMASCILFDLALMLLMVTRIVWTLLYKLTELIPFLKLMPLRNSKDCHMYLAYVMIICSIVHTICHYVNFYRISHAPLSELRKVWPNATAEYLYGGTRPKIKFIELLVGSVPGLTGHAMILVASLMFLTSLQRIRMKNFELFWYTHHVFWIFFALLFGHGTLGLIEAPQAAYWLAPLLAVYVFERFNRLYHLIFPSKCLSIVQEDSDVVSLVFSKPSVFGIPWSYKTGQWGWICIPKISLTQWHPFTVTSCPEDKNLSMDIKISGDWTEKLSELALADVKPSISFDGCYGADTQMVGRYKVSVLIGCGIGITPFVAILKHFVNTAKYGKIYLIATMRKRPYSCLLKVLNEIFVDKSVNCKFELFLYLTGGHPETDKLDLPGTIVYGSRPSFQQLFRGFVSAHPKETIGVFTCGPKQFSTTVKVTCKLYTKLSPTKFEFHREVF